MLTKSKRNYKPGDVFCCLNINRLGDKSINEIHFVISVDTSNDSMKFIQIYTNFKYPTAMPFELLTDLPTPRKNERLLCSADDV